MKKMVLKQVDKLVRGIAEKGVGAPTYWGFYDIKKPDCLKDSKKNINMAFT